MVHISTTVRPPHRFVVLSLLAVCGIIAGNLVAAYDDSDCIERGEFYKEENVCIQIHPKRVPWKEAIVKCTFEGSELVEIWTREKSQFMTEKLKAEGAYWIGLSDEDEDWTYEYPNGSKLHTQSLGLGQWQAPINGRVATNDDDMTPTRGGCVLLNLTSSAWTTAPCDDKFGFICQHPLVQDNYKYHFQPSYGAESTLCDIEDCECHPDDWLYLANHKKYAVANQAPATHQEAQRYCMMLGGNLLKVDSQDISETIRDMKSWDPIGVYYRIGLRYENTTDLWEWTDRSDLDKSGAYQNWFPGMPTQEGCVVAIWDYDAKWRVTDCHSSHFHMCEGTTPCSAKPMMIINNRLDWLGLTEKLVINEQMVEIKCFLYGYTKEVVRLQLTCDAHHLEETGTRPLASIKKLYVDASMQGKQCQCMSVRKDGLVEKSRFTIVFRTCPVLLDGEQNYSALHSVSTSSSSSSSSSSTGSAATTTTTTTMVTFEILSNPLPTNYNLFENHELVSKDRYSMRFEPNEDTDFQMRYYVRLNLSDFQLNVAYMLILDNGIEKSLKYSFFLRDMAPALEKTNSLLSTTSVLILFILNLTVGVIAATMYKEWKSWPKRRGSVDLTAMGEEPELQNEYTDSRTPRHSTDSSSSSTMDKPTTRATSEATSSLHPVAYSLHPTKFSEGSLKDINYSNKTTVFVRDRRKKK